MKRRERDMTEGRVGFFERTPRNRVLGELLRSVGYDVRYSPNGEEEDVELWIACLTNQIEASAALSQRASRPDTPLLGLMEPSQDQALEGAEAHELCEVVPLTPKFMGEVIDSARRIIGQEDSQEVRFGAPSTYQRTYEADTAGANCSAYELAAFLTEYAVAQAHRIRIVSAVYEATDNARRHAFVEGTGTFSVRVEIQRTRVNVCITDQGPGFDATRVLTDSVPAALPMRGTERTRHGNTSGGLRRLAALSEESDIQSDEKGTRVQLGFELTPVRFEEEGTDLSDADFLDPDRARELVRALKEGDQDVGDFSPAMALTIGRLLGGAQQGH